MRFCSMAAAAVGLVTRSREVCRSCGTRDQTVGDLAAVPGMCGLHRIAAAHLPPWRRRTHPRPYFPDYHETLFAAAGQGGSRLEVGDGGARRQVRVVEGAIPTKDDGVYCAIGGRTAIEILNDVASKAGAIIATGSCASWGGVPSADPESDRSLAGARDPQGKTVVNIPGCPANPYNLLGTVLQHAPPTAPSQSSMRKDGRSSPTAAPFTSIARGVRTSMRAGSPEMRETKGIAWDIASTSSDARDQRRANCSVMHFGEVVDAWPIGLGHPCFGCTEKNIGFRMPMHQTVEIYRPTPPDTHPPINAQQGHVSPVATAVGRPSSARWSAAALRPRRSCRLRQTTRFVTQDGV